MNIEMSQIQEEQHVEKCDHDYQPEVEYPGWVKCTKCGRETVDC